VHIDLKPILHIPHSGVEVPVNYHDSFIGGVATIERETLILGDLKTDQLFIFDPERSIPVVFPYSRVFVDVERFRDDSNEPMSTRGMGVIYQNGHDLQPIRHELTTELRKSILIEYYDPHHAKLSHAVDDQLKTNGRALIIDCHSFPKNRLPYEDSKQTGRPEICIGTDNFHTPKAVLDSVLYQFLKKGYTAALDQPFSGALVPMKHFHKTKEVVSIMIEVRRDLFLEETSGQQNARFNKVKSDINDAIYAAMNAL
jgi:N-formylglutamate amidohydrolase